MLQQRGYYTITLSDESKVNLLFNVESIFEFCDQRKMSFQAMFAAFGLGGMAGNDFAYLYLCAAHAYAREKKQECKYTIQDAYAWLEDIGVVSDEWKSISGMIQEIAENLATGKKKKLKVA